MGELWLKNALKYRFPKESFRVFVEFLALPAYKLKACGKK